MKDESFSSRLKVSFTTWVLKFLHGTNRWQIENEQVLNQLIKDKTPVILVTWHGKLLPIFYRYAKHHFYGLAGMHRDAELISRVGDRLGWKMLRGSSSDNGNEVYKEILQKLERPGTVVAITPDGPKGPAKIPKPGTIRAAQSTGAVILPVVAHSSRTWGFTNWDTFYVVRPFGKIHMVFGKPLRFSRDDDYQTCVDTLKTSLDSLEKEVNTRVAV